ncbi:hypothetical protein CLAFUW4_13685 [Fulvia fulva]|uniref:Glucose receptor Git3 N-terminal domain-containing protein n=1 Tax=Passalora fulva TaxID=5499 RepID=A0A9Q8PL41_PASFU|nr:uncharacterized protein CLAFUR5_13534 [Fulvia fulva]KAK4610039.1 hypothetical protein CLAFUR4_13688 [Fulvia fulva]KAK4610862.1 hypothetical protein CLAFUR0_13692 [Fulvia fulva]UJO24614.1 hypothetical protein CLAFUR5_13534 [Fulvia fulva]WPV21687.1 hypothetical protein CLAFUW4_13685 [Fulvia fulva]WPV36824.1 hypothetical protein CLAFUW7_13693 [Fulvia fulva]
MSHTDTSGTVTPLPEVLRRGLVALTFFGLLSLTLATALFVHLVYRLVTWRPGTLARINQYVALLLNLVLADMQQAAGFSMSAHWLMKDGIIAHTDACWAQGFVLNAGDVAAAVFTFAMAGHVFADIVCDYRLGHKAFLLTILSLWVSVYVCSSIGIIMFPKDFYAGAGAWCWINAKYMDERLYMHYLWLLMTEFGAVVIYSLMFLVLWKRVRSFFYADSDPDGGMQLRAESAARSVIVYPLIYVICTLPAVVVRLKIMTGSTFGWPTMTAIGVFLSSIGTFDVVLYTITRRSLIFGPTIPDQNTHGLQTFTTWGNFRTDHFYGTTTTVEVNRARNDSTAPFMQRGDEDSGDGFESQAIDKSDKIIMTATVEQTSNLATEEEIEAIKKWERERYPEQYPGDDDPSHMELTFLSDNVEIETSMENDGLQLHRTLRPVLAIPPVAVTRSAP